MAIAFDAVTTSTTFPFNHTTSGSNRALVVVVFQSGSANDIAVTYNSVSLTKQTYVTVPVAGDSFAIFTLLNPTSGTNSVAITGTSILSATAVSYTGVNAFSGAATNTNSGATITQNVVVSVANSWVLSAASGRTGPHNLTPSTGVTNDRTSGNTYVGTGDSGPEAVSTISHTWSNSFALDNASSGIAIEPSAAVTVVSPLSTLLTLGVG